MAGAERHGLCGSREVRVLAGEVDPPDVVLTRAERDVDQQMMSPDGHPKLLHLWPVKLLQAGRVGL